MDSKTLKQIRAKTGLTQSEFGEVIGVPARTIERWEQGRSPVIELAKREIYRQFKAAIDEIFKGG